MPGVACVPPRDDCLQGQELWDAAQVVRPAQQATRQQLGLWPEQQHGACLLCHHLCPLACPCPCQHRPCLCLWQWRWHCLDLCHVSWGSDCLEETGEVAGHSPCPPKHSGLPAMVGRHVHPAMVAGRAMDRTHLASDRRSLSNTQRHPCTWSCIGCTSTALSSSWRSPVGRVPRASE